MSLLQLLLNVLWLLTGGVCFRIPGEVHDRWARELHSIGVAARFIELVSGTPRHEAMVPNDACHEIAHHAGSSFDPAVVEALLELLEYRRRANRSA